MNPLKLLFTCIALGGCGLISQQSVYEGITIPKPGSLKARIMDKDQSLGVLDLVVELRTV